MRQTLFLSFIALLLTFTQGCKKVYPEGPAVREIRNVTGFGKIETTFSANVEYTKSADSRVEVLAAENIQRYVIAEVVDGKLVLRTPDNVWIKKGSVTVYVAAPTLAAITLTGNGNFTALDEIETETMGLKVTGSGNVTLAKLTTSSLRAQISGDGDVAINNGESETQELTITGSGDYNAHQMQSKEAMIKLTGSGDAKVWTMDKLNVTITGSGDVRYVGNPVVAASITGSGNVKGL